MNIIVWTLLILTLVSANAIPPSLSEYHNYTALTNMIFGLQEK